jgi:hypothetical protein
MAQAFSTHDDNLVNVAFIMTDSLGKESRFTFVASPAQAAEYHSLPLSKILPVESSGFALILDIVAFVLMSMSAAEREKNLRNARKEANDVDMSMDYFFAQSISDFEPRFRTCAVSLNSSPFASSANIAIEEVKKAVSSIERMQTQKFGVVGKLAPSLGSDNILPIYKQFEGEISSYLSNKRDINRLLLENYPCPSASPLVNECCLSTLAKINKKNCYIPPRHASFACGVAGGTVGASFRLSVPDGKVNLADHCLLKANGTRHLKVKNVSLTLSGQEVSVDSKTTYKFVNESSVAPLVNADTPFYAAGNAEIRDTGKEYLIDIPIKIHNDFTTKKSDSGYIHVTNSLDT